MKCPKCSTYFYSRSTAANNYYWGVVIEILSDHFGYLPEEMHEEMKLLFNPRQSKFDPLKTYGASTVTLTVPEFQQYIDNIKVWAGSMGVHIPEPNESCSDNTPGTTESGAAQNRPN